MQWNTSSHGRSRYSKDGRALALETVEDINATPLVFTGRWELTVDKVTVDRVFDTFEELDAYYDEHFVDQPA